MGLRASLLLALIAQLRFQFLAKNDGCVLMVSRGSGEWHDLDRPNWHLQTRQRAQTVESSLSRGGFSAWTDVPPVGVRDPQLPDPASGARQHFVGLPGNCREASAGAGGKRCIPEVRKADRPDGKRIFDTRGDGSLVAPRPSGLRKVIPRGGIPPPGTADPNRAYGGGNTTPKPDGVYINTEGRGEVKYQCWRPEQLVGAFGGDWNLNTRYGNRKVKVMSNGMPQRSMETPVAWPTYAGYPPSRDPVSKRTIDYALHPHGNTFSMKPPLHPDVVQSHRNRLAASNPPASYSSFRHAGERYY